MADSKVPGLPAPTSASGPFDNYYVLYFVNGGNPTVSTKTFKHDGNLKSAIQRGQRHCDVIHRRFLRVTPFISNLDADERLILGDDEVKAE